MSKMGNWVFEMQEDAYDMTLDEFIEKHGSSQAPVWYECNEQDCMEMDDGA